MHSIRYKKASPEHISVIEVFERDNFKEEAFSRRQISYHIKSPNSVAIVATSDGNIIGYIIGALRRRYKTCNICTFCLREDYRHRNVASGLLHKLEKECVLKSINRLDLEVKESNIPARKFYKKSGFIESRKLPGYYSDGATAIEMEKSLSHLFTLH
ncbi:MAG: GNAT family N-acetyltransferase [Candidatus Brocadiales bacterium]